MVAEWDRATRSMWDGFKIMIRIADRGAALKVLDKPVLDLTTPSGRGLLVFLSSLAEEERQRIVQRAADGRKAAKGAYLENPCSDYSTPTVARCARWAWRGENNRRKYQIQIGRIHRTLTMRPPSSLFYPWSVIPFLSFRKPLAGAPEHFGQ